MSPRVLVVDDLQFMRSLLVDICTGAGMEVVAQAENGREGIAAYMASEPDVVLLDIIMPEMDGLEALARVKRLDPAARVVMCSALHEQAIIIRAIQLGARDFVVKPFRAERVVSAITRVLRADGVWPAGAVGARP